jgi:hypothetical protein
MHDLATIDFAELARITGGFDPVLCPHPPPKSDDFWWAQQYALQRRYKAAGTIPASYGRHSLCDTRLTNPYGPLPGRL